MAHGQKDYGMYAAKDTVFGISDMAELAVRLGSIVSFDRRGEVVFLDSFEGGLKKWEGTLHTNPGTIEESEEAARSGGVSAKFTGALLAPTQAGLVHYEHYPVLSKLGTEISFTLQADLTYIYLYSDVYNGTTLREYRLRYDLQNTKLQYQDSAGAWQDLATGVDLYYPISLFHTLKLVADADEGEYLRAILNHTEYDMSGITAKSGASATLPHWGMAIIAHWESDTAKEIFMDDAIMTQNEP